MPDFDDAARSRKSLRITVPFNPDNLDAESMLQLESKVKTLLKDGYLPCPSAWDIARETAVSRKAVGEAADRLGIRISGCQIGFFSKSKTPNFDAGYRPADEGITGILGQMDKNKTLTCIKVFQLAEQYSLKPLDISRKAGAMGLKIRECQLGCF